MLRYLLAMDESCPDYMRVFTNVRFADMEIRFDFSCSGTLVSEMKHFTNPLQTFSAHLADKAARIVSSGKKYKFFFHGTINMLLTPDLDFIQRFSTTCHSSSIIESRVDLEDEI